MSKPWNMARAASKRRPHRRSVLAPVGVPILMALEDRSLVPFVEPPSKVCGHYDCDCGAKPAAPPAEQARPAGGWTQHSYCSGGWLGCWHLAGSNLHVFSRVGHEVVTPRECGGLEPHSELYSGTLDDCKLWVEQYERRHADLEWLIDQARRAAQQQVKLPAGWKPSKEGFVHVSGATVAPRLVLTARGDWNWWTRQPCDPCTDPKRTCEEAMACALGYYTFCHVNHFAFGARNCRLILDGGMYTSAQSAALAALEYDAKKRGLS